jgi:hypothetical protein
VTASDVARERDGEDGLSPVHGFRFCAASSAFTQSASFGLTDEAVDDSSD